MEFLLVFLISFIVLVGVALAFALGKPPTYRPSRAEIMALLVDLMEKRLEVARWEMFLSLPILHDPELENIRKGCLVVAFGDNEHPPAGEGLSGAIYDRDGIQRIRVIAVKLDHLIKSEPSSKLF
ncbi:hypothetical protein ACMXYX_02155 [Neptuniibacter sp. QD72_48]|uniref:hypothetical protein n=1 Tax=unclassified Neptuniibacter TaxID=2630693 RepID=UPI0039F6F034